MNAENIKRHEELICAASTGADKNKKAVLRDSDRCRLHFMAPAGWMNDPNGLIVYEGEYHVFYQYNPFSSFWGRMHWGHSKSSDLINWEHLPVALAPSEPYEYGGGCFSGSAVEHDGVLNLFYSASAFGEGVGGHVQAQCRAYSTDGVHFIKDEKNPLIPEPPEGYSRSFRDPKVWKHENYWYMVVGGAKDERGQVFLYRSADMREWSFCSVLAQSEGDMGFMWECPDFFSLDGKCVLMISAMIKGAPRPVNKTLYIVGDFDYETYGFKWDRLGQIDFGDEFYAPQTFLDREGRRTLFGWLNTWNFAFGEKNLPRAVEGKKWCGSLSLPRVLGLDDDNMLITSPHPVVRELAKETIVSLAYAGKKIMRGEVCAKGISCYVIKALFEVENYEAAFGILFGAEREAPAAAFTYHADKNIAEFERFTSEYYNGHMAEGFTELENRRLEMEVYVDGPVVEIYLQNGRVRITGHADPKIMLGGFSFFSERGDVFLKSLDVLSIKGRDAKN